MTRRTKIVCTLGPASSSAAVFEALIKAGMNIARFNFSHGTHANHAELIQKMRNTAQRLDQPVALLQDLQGPKIRVGEFPSNGILLKNGQRVVVTTREVLGNDTTIPINYPPLHEEVKPGNHLLLDDGLLDLKIEKVEGQDILCKVLVGGPLCSHKGLNLPGIPVRVPSLSAKDKDDLVFGLQQGVDFVALSFVRRAQDVLDLKEEIRKQNCSTPVIAKIEKPEAYQNIDEIIAVADGIMVARGDLGVEIGPERVPIIQKEIVSRCIAANRPVIIATQMLESMRNNPRPTRAEASDVANAILDGADAVMLSGETSVGSYPVESVRMMDRIIQQAEKYLLTAKQFMRRRSQKEHSFPGAISESASYAASQLNAKAIVAFTQSGFTAKLISKYRPRTPIFAFTLSESVRHQLLLYWGVETRLMTLVHSIDEMIQSVDLKLREEKIVRPGDVIAIVAGAPIGVRGTTNLLTLHRIGG